MLSRKSFNHHYMIRLERSSLMLDALQKKKYHILQNDDTKKMLRKMNNWMTFQNSNQILFGKQANIPFFSHHYTRQYSSTTVTLSKIPTTSTINEEEVNKFGRMADDWWNVEGKLRTLHLMNPIRIDFIRRFLEQEYISKSKLNPNGDIHSPSSSIDSTKISDNRLNSSILPLNGLKILDIGCGGGIASESLARLGATVTGVDASIENIYIAQHHVSSDPEIREKVNYEYTTVENLASIETNKESFDAVVALEVIEHVADVELFIKSCIELLKPNGALILSTINRTMRSFLTTIVGAEYILNIVPIGTHEWTKYIKPEEITLILESNRVHLKEMNGIHFNPISETFSFSKDLKVNYLLGAIKGEQ